MIYVRWKEDPEGYLVKLFPGEEIIRSLTHLCLEKRIEGASVSAIGALKKAELGYFDDTTGTYLTRMFEGGFELVSLLGNISVFQEEPKIHLHACLGDHDYNIFGGHLVWGEVSVTCECIIRVLSWKLIRKEDPETGLPLWDL
jgi:predicted DNA-binding protein with PD1-like motif